MGLRSVWVWVSVTRSSLFEGGWSDWGPESDPGRYALAKGQPLYRAKNVGRNRVVAAMARGGVDLDMPAVPD